MGRKKIFGQIELSRFSWGRKQKRIFLYWGPDSKKIGVQKVIKTIFLIFFYLFDHVRFVFNDGDISAQTLLSCF